MAADRRGSVLSGEEHITFQEMSKVSAYLTEMMRAGLLRRARIHPSRAKRIRARRRRQALLVTDGPFAEAKEVMGFARSEQVRG
jgi:hypothetical protein